MHTTKSAHSNRDTIQYHADKPYHVAPKIKRTYFAEKIRMYETTSGIYFADMYDKVFGVAKQLINRNAKDANPADVYNLNF